MPNRALVFWWLFSAGLGLFTLQLVMWIAVGSRLVVALRVLRQVQALLVDLHTHQREALDLLHLWVRTWGEPPEQVKQALQDLIESRRAAATRQRDRHRGHGG